jgi:hypothetical protein
MPPFGGLPWGIELHLLNHHTGRGDRCCVTLQAPSFRRDATNVYVARFC